MENKASELEKTLSGLRSVKSFLINAEMGSMGDGSRHQVEVALRLVSALINGTVEKDVTLTPLK